MTGRRGAVTVALVALVALGGLGAAPAVATSAPVPCAASAEPRVAVVVAFPGGDVVRRCVAPGGSGLDVLARAGFAPVTHGFGTVGGSRAVCALTNPENGEQMGCAAGPSCLTCLNPDYWGYYRGTSRGYQYQPAGGGSSTPTTSTVEAWQWGSASSWQHDRASARTLCPTAVPTPTTTAPAPTTAPTRPPATAADPAPGSTAVDDGGGRPGPPAGGATTPGGSTATTSVDPTEGPPTTGPGGAPSTGATADSTDVDPGGNRAVGDGDEVASGVEAGTVEGGGPTGSPGGSGTPLASLAVTGLVVAAIGALAVRARRRRSLADAT